MSPLHRLLHLFVHPAAGERASGGGDALLARRERRHRVPRAPAPIAGISAAFLRPAQPPAPGSMDRPRFVPPAGTATMLPPEAARSAGGPDRARQASRSTAGRPRDQPTVAVLSPPGEALPVAASLAMELRRAQRARTALVAVWPPGAAGRASGGPSARPAGRRLAASLAARGLEARAAGGLAVVALDEDPAAAATSFDRAAAAAGGAPVVVAVGGPRPPALDALLADRDLVVVAFRPGTGGAVGELTVTRLTEQGIPARTLELPAALPGRLLAGMGLLVPPMLRAPLADVLREPV